MKHPKEASNVQEYQALQIEWMSCMTALKRELLETENLALKSVFNVGYEIVHPSEQTEWAMDVATHRIGLAVKEAFMRLRHVRVDELTDEQRKENADAKAKLAALTGMNRQLTYKG